jgi:hypothetical protein
LKQRTLLARARLRELRLASKKTLNDFPFTSDTC